MTTLYAKGTNGQVEFDGQTVTISRKGGFGRTTVGKGTKVIPIASITAVNWKPPGVGVNGFIQFVVLGALEAKKGFGSQTINAAKDENSVIVSKGKAADFEQIRDAVQRAVADFNAGRISPAGHGQSPAQQLATLADLLSQGLLTQDEFDAQKAKLL